MEKSTNGSIKLREEGAWIASFVVNGKRLCYCGRTKKDIVEKLAQGKRRNNR